MDGNVNLAPASLALASGLAPPVPAQDRWLNENAMIKGHDRLAQSARQPDGSYVFTFSGPLSRLQPRQKVAFDPKALAVRASSDAKLRHPPRGGCVLPSAVAARRPSGNRLPQPEQGADAARGRSPRKPSAMRGGGPPGASQSRARRRRAIGDGKESTSSARPALPRRVRDGAGKFREVDPKDDAVMAYADALFTVQQLQEWPAVQGFLGRQLHVQGPRGAIRPDAAARKLLTSCRPRRGPRRCRPKNSGAGWIRSTAIAASRGLHVCGALTPSARRWGCGCGHAKNRALAGVTRKPAPDGAFFELASPHPRAAGSARDPDLGCDRVSRASVCALCSSLSKPSGARRGPAYWETARR